MNEFIDYSPSLESYWRSVILFGKNSASYKFSLGKSLLDLVSKEKTFISLEELAVRTSTRMTDKGIPVVANFSMCVVNTTMAQLLRAN